MLIMCLKPWVCVKEHHYQLFHNIHDKQRPILEQAPLAKFYTRYGIPEAKFNTTYINHSPITSKIAQAKNLTAHDIWLSGVPSGDREW